MRIGFTLLPSLKKFATIKNLICDVVCKKVPYGGTNITGPRQTPRIMRGVCQGLRYLPLMSIYNEHFCRSLCSLKYNYYHKRVKIADLKMLLFVPQ